MLFADLLRTLGHNLRSSRVNAMLIVLTLSLGMAATTLVFSLLDTLLLRPLPYEGADRIQFLWTVNKSTPKADELTSPARWRDIRDQSTTLEAIGAFYTENLNLTAIPGNGAGAALEAPERVLSVRYLPGFFASLGVKPFAGRLTTAEEERNGGPKAILVTHDFWRTRLGSRLSVIDQQVQFNGTPYRIAGILPAGFRFQVANARFFVPAQLFDGLYNYRSARFVQVILRRKPEATNPQVAADIDRVVKALGAQYGPEESAYSVRLEDPRSYFVGANTTRAIWLLTGAVALLLLIACANAANLMIARGVARQRQHAISLALGSNPYRLVVETVLEGILLSLAAAAVGSGITSWGLSVVSQYWTTLPTFRDLEVDWRVAAFALSVAAITGIGASLIPGWRASRQDALESLRSATSSASVGGRAGFRRILVGVQIALCFLLLTSSWALGEQLRRLLDTRPGFRTANILTFQVTLPWETPRDRMQSFFDELRRRLATAPEARQVAFSDAMPLEDRFPSRFRVEGREGELPLRTLLVSPDYFEVLGIPLLAGRVIGVRDTATTKHVAVLNQSAAQTLFPGADPIGKQLIYPYGKDTLLPIEVVGVVADSRSALDQAPVPVVYQGFQLATWPSPTFYVATKGAPEDAIASCRRQLRELNPSQAIHRIQSMDRYLEGAVAEPRLSFVLIALFAGAAGLLCFLGLYGVMSWFVTARRSEIGLRLALGARNPQLIRLLLRQGLTPVAIGMGAGLCAFVAGRELLSKFSSLLPPTGPLALVASAVAIAVIASLAILLPAWRALAIHPREALAGDSR